MQRLTQLEEHLISFCLVFAQIYKIHGYDQYTIHGSMINVSSNINKTQSILSRNVCPNYIMLILKDLLKTPLCMELNVTVS